MSSKKKFSFQLNDLPLPILKGTPSPTDSFSSESNTTPKSLPDTLSKYVDPSGKLSFMGKAVLHATGVDFSEGQSFRINFAELTLLEELGRGQYGVVNKVYHNPTKVTMAMKQIRLEISEASFRQILMELEVLHKAHSRYIVDFYGAFFLESCAYICMEFMDAGSLDKMYGVNGLEESILCRVAECVVKGLKFLKEDLNIIHRDIKPSNILINLQGEIKLCDFGVSGQLIQSMAKTNIGCQTYMAPERIAVKEEISSYSVSSDIWSLGLTLWEAANGGHPFQNSNYDSLFAQLNAIVNETVPELKAERFSIECRDFLNKCLSKNPKLRPSYSQLLEHPFFIKYRDVDVDMKKWANQAYLEYLARKKTASS